MRLAMAISFIIWNGAVAQQTTPARVLEGADQLIATEPAAFAVDSHLLMLERNCKPVVSGDLLSAYSDVSQKYRGDVAASLLVRGVSVVAAKGDLTAARELLNAMEPRVRAGTEADYLAAAYDKLISSIGPHQPSARGLIIEGLQRGAVQIRAARELIRAAVSKDPSSALEVYAAMLAGFPTNGAVARDVIFLLDVTDLIRNVSDALAREGLRKSAEAVLAKGFNQAGKEEITATYGSGDKSYVSRSTNETLLMQIAVLGAKVGWKLSESQASQLREMPAALSTGNWRLATFPLKIR